MRERLKAAITGQKVLSGFAKGRQRAIEVSKARAALNASVVAILANQDRDAGRPRRGLAGRIARKMKWEGKGTLSERHVKRILDTLMSMSDSEEETERLTNKEGAQ